MAGMQLGFQFSKSKFLVQELQMQIIFNYTKTFQILSICFVTKEDTSLSQGFLL